MVPCLYKKSEWLMAAVVVVLLVCPPMVLAVPPPMRSANWMSQGPIEDAACQIEDLEQANDSQLYEILQELKRTSYFRSFWVDLEYKCPLHNEEDEEFECPSSRKQTTSSLMDAIEEPHEPACSVDLGGGSAGLFGSANALDALQSNGFSSPSQEKAFSWVEVTDTVYHEVTEPSHSIPEDALLPDTFWKDMCSSIGANQPTVVNLALNPECNTGYNGTHLWKAIYEENCGGSQCFEERVLYKLMSALHTSTTLSIAYHYYPPSVRKNRTSWEPNPTYFVEKLGDHPEYISNLHFGFAVLLRALRKAAVNLYDAPLDGDMPTQKLLQRLLDTSILSSCTAAFDAFDETTLFQEKDSPHQLELKTTFKGVFHNVSSILDCVQCQQCKLHGKLAMTGYGAALKVLLMENDASLTPNEIVAIINTVTKFSESLRHVQILSRLAEERKKTKPQQQLQPPSTTSPIPTTPATPFPVEGWAAVDTAVAAIARLGKEELVSWDQEQVLVQAALSTDPRVIVLAKHYGQDPDKLWKLLQQQEDLWTNMDSPVLPDAIIVGSGLAGLAASLHLLDRGGRIVIIEKEHLLGGNSNKASSGINAAFLFDTANNNTVDRFYNDTLRSAGSSAQPHLIQTLVESSASAVTWLRERLQVDLSLTAQLGGHSAKRTHRPSNGMVGAEIIYHLQKAVKSYVKQGSLTLLTDTKVTNLVTNQETGAVVGVECVGPEGDTQQYRAHSVVLATGGFASDRSRGSYLDQYRPELLNMPTTAGDYSTGDGIEMARVLGAGWVDMDKGECDVWVGLQICIVSNKGTVQLHPTGWVDPSNPNATTKILAAELMRGVGGILLNDKGERFCNELGTRAYVTSEMLKHDAHYAATGNWSLTTPVPSFSLILASAAAENAKKHVDLYTHKGLLTKLEGVAALAKWLGLPKSAVVPTLSLYRKASLKGTDEFGKSTFKGVPQSDLQREVFYAGRVTPVLHYCMGGITINGDGQVLRQDGDVIPGLFAVGEVSGGVHGVNRLAGNSLLECTVFGSKVGKSLPISAQSSATARGSSIKKNVEQVPKKTLQTISKTELEKHNSDGDCWVEIHGTVYDLTAFAEEHPAGPDSIRELAGKQGTEAFTAVHNKGMLEDFEDEIVGVYEI